MNNEAVNQSSIPGCPQNSAEAPAYSAQANPLTCVLNAPNPADMALISVGRSVPAEPHPSALITLSPQPGKKPRNGKIARLPKPVRDIVNQMLFNNISQSRISGALAEIGFCVTQRNISNWRTRGGYREWRLAQEHALELRLHQDHLVDLIRRHDASELPEVGLQLAATQLSQFFLTPEATRLLASNPQEYDRRIAMLSRVSAQLKGLQKDRDDCAKALGSRHDPDRIRQNTASELTKLREVCSSSLGHSAKDPAVPHRNDLPDPQRLFDCTLCETKPPQLTFEQILEIFQRSGMAKKNVADGAAPSLPTEPRA